jgi:hypothetical protein
MTKGATKSNNYNLFPLKQTIPHSAWLCMFINLMCLQIDFSLYMRCMKVGKSELTHNCVQIYIGLSRFCHYKYISGALDALFCNLLCEQINTYLSYHAPNLHIVYQQSDYSISRFIYIVWKLVPVYRFRYYWYIIGALDALLYNLLYEEINTYYDHIMDPIPK